MKEVIIEVLNDMAEDLSILQLKKLQEVLLKRLGHDESKQQPAQNEKYLEMLSVQRELKDVLKEH